MDPTRAGLLAAILADPDDDLARLVFADYIEEAGETARANYIRLQIEAARTLGDPKRHLWLTGQAARLRPQFRDEVDPLLKGATTGINVVRRRGFLEEVRGPWGLIVPRAFGLFAVAPVLHLIFPRPVPPAHVFAGASYLTRVRTLVLTGDTYGPRDQSGRDWLDPAAAHNLAETPHLSGVRRLTLAGNPLGDGWVNWFVPRLPFAAVGRNLRELDLSATRLGDAAGSLLASAEALDRLTLLNVRSNYFSEAVQEQLRRRFGGRVLV